MPTAGEQMHWSIDHDTGFQRPYFGNALRAVLESWAPGTAHDGAVRRYELLPNYAAGWHQGWLDGGGELRIGGAEIARGPDSSGGAHYRVSHDNATSGERVALDFHTTGDPLPRLTGAWSVTTTNSAGDGYRGIEVAGSTAVDSGRRVVSLSINGIELRTGELDAAVPLTSWWALFDGLPSIVAGAEEGEPFAVLEDLEKVRTPCTVRALADGPIEVAGHRLRGYCQHGAGMLPSYWWLDEGSTVCVVTSTLHTMVLRAPGGGEAGSA
ncbi:MAG: hypothetical protein OXJ62_04230 [Spirochaetaceae bacterium]|nr:hypothetical protein [Spirochaetaceae bacterium]